MEIESELRPLNSDPGRRRLGPVAWVGIALLAVLAGYLVVGRGPSPSDSLAGRPAPTSSSAPSPVSSPVPVAGPNQRQYLGVTTICAPVTDGLRRLSVSFEVSDVSAYPVQLTAVDGVLPDGGLRRHGPATRGGSCRKPGDQPLAGRVEPGQSVFYTLVFDLPKTCPARYPIQVRVRYAAGGFTESLLSLLYSDLSVPDFDSCGPGRGPAAKG